MKILLFLSILLFSIPEETIKKVVNSCGDKEHKTTGKMPEKVEDCKDDDEPACKLVKIQKKDPNMNKNFCAIIHGKYKDVIDEVRDLIDAENIEVLESSYYIKNKYIFFLPFFLFY